MKKVVTQVICRLITNLRSCNNISKGAEEFKSSLKEKSPRVGIYNRTTIKTVVPVLPGECVDPVPAPPAAVQRSPCKGGVGRGRQLQPAGPRSFGRQQLGPCTRWDSAGVGVWRFRTCRVLREPQKLSARGKASPFRVRKRK